jgi:hypothetical protein
VSSNIGDQNADTLFVDAKEIVEIAGNRAHGDVARGNFESRERRDALRKRRGLNPAGNFQFVVDGEESFFVRKGTLLWKAIAIGDCCLIQRRENRICEAFPIADSAKFGSNPVLIPSMASLQSKAFAGMGVLEGTAQEGDEFLLLSDAIAAWYLEGIEDSDEQRVLLRSLMSSHKHDETALLIQTLRSQGKMRNDDVTVVRIGIGVE